MIRAIVSKMKNALVDGKHVQEVLFDAEGRPTVILKKSAEKNAIKTGA